MGRTHPRLVHPRHLAWKRGFLLPGRFSFPWLRPICLTALLLVTLGNGAYAARPSSIPPSNQPVVGPQGTLEAVARGYRDRSVDSVVAHYTADYRFHAYGDSLLGFYRGISREQEEHSLRNLFGGIVQNGDTLRPPADSLGIVMDGFQEGVDAEHPDSTQHYRIVVVARFEMGFRYGDKRMFTMSRQHVFHMVRGDVALLLPGQQADPQIWYVRRWLEDVSGVREALTQRQGDCGEPQAPSPGPRVEAAQMSTNVALGIRPLTNPACARLTVACDLPAAGSARIEVYDVSGRRVNTRDVRAAEPGRMSVDAGAGTKLRPGAYWVRLSQGSRSPVTRMVMVAQ